MQNDTTHTPTESLYRYAHARAGDKGTASIWRFLLTMRATMTGCLTRSPRRAWRRFFATVG